MEIKRYHPESLLLKPLIKYFWVSDSFRNIDMHHKILPMTNIDLLVNLSSPIFYDRRGTRHATPGNLFFSGLSTEHMVMQQQGRIQLIGASFFPAGFYPFFRTPVSEFKNTTVGLDLILGGKAVNLEDRLNEAASLPDKIKALEAFFLTCLNHEPWLSDNTFELLNRFSSAGMGIRAFCETYGVHPRTLERRFNTYVGATPKQFQRLQRFQNALNGIMNRSTDRQTCLAHEFGFYDQAHFIREFKAFTGASPSRFLNERKAFMQIMNIS